MVSELIDVITAFPSNAFFTVAAVLAGLLWLLGRQDKTGKPPGPWGLPLVGHIPFLGKNPIPKLEQYRKQYGDVFSLRLGSYQAVVLNGTPTIKAALTTRPDEFGDRPLLYSFQLMSQKQNGNIGLNIPFGPRWKVLRKISNIALRSFANYRNNPVEDIVMEEGNRLVKFFLSNGKAGFNPRDEISLSVGSVIYQILFGRSASIREDEHYCNVARSTQDFVEFVSVGNPVDTLPWTRFFFKDRTNKFLQLVERLYKVLKVQGEQHQATYDHDSIRDVMDSLLKSASDLPNEEKDEDALSPDLIISVTGDLLGAGVDTIATALLWAIYFMILYPDVQHRVQKDIDEQIGSDRFPTMEDKKSLPYVEATVLETLRLGCITPLSVPRKTTRDVKLGEYEIPEGTFVMVNQQSTCMDPEVWGDPEKFRPDRFLTENSSGELSIDTGLAESFMVFGAGRRRCIGEFLAKVEIFLFFTLLMQRCSFSKVPGEEYTMGRQFGLTVKPQPYKALAIQR